MAKTSPIQVRLTETQKAAAEARAKRDESSLAEVVREAVKAYTTAPCKRCGGTGAEPCK